MKSITYTEEEILKNNEILALYMGLKKHIGGGGIISFYTQKIDYCPGIIWIQTGTYNYVDCIYCWFDYQLNFHASWDWLMPVVQKIYETTKIEVMITFDIEKQYDIVLSFIKFQVLKKMETK